MQRVPYLFLSPSCTLHSGTRKYVNDLKIAQEQHFGLVSALAAFFRGRMSHSTSSHISCTNGTMCAATLFLIIWCTVKARSKLFGQAGFLLYFSTTSLLIVRFGNIHQQNGCAPFLRGGADLVWGIICIQAIAHSFQPHFHVFVDPTDRRSTAIRCSSCVGKRVVHWVCHL